MKSGHAPPPIAVRSTFGSRIARAALVLLLSVHGPRLTAAQTQQSLEELHTADQVRRLTADEAAKHHPVRLRGVITAYDQSLFYRFIQDDTAGIYLGDSANLPALTGGQLVEIQGITSPGEYAPVVLPQHIQILGAGAWPQPKPVSFEQLSSGQEDSQFVEIRGVVRSAYVDATGHQLLDIATGGGRLTAYAHDLPVEHLGDLVDSTVRARGVCVTLFNHRRQLFQLRLVVPRPADLVVEQAAPQKPFAVPSQNITSLLQFNPEVPYDHRIKVIGTVSYQEPGNNVFIQDKTEGLCVQTKQDTPLRPGDRIEVLGFPARGDYTPLLEDATYKKIVSGAEPEPDIVDSDEALKGVHDSRLVRITATLLDRSQQTREQFLVLQAGGFIFHAYFAPNQNTAALAQLRNESRVSVTGVCLVETGSEWHAGADWRAKSFRLLLRSPDDVVLLGAPPWWSLGRLLWAVGILALVVMGAFTWVAVLRRRVQAQTEIISQKLQVEASLKERYLDLFENANDMVYTHDLMGHITSINQAGEQLLQRRRDEILSQNILEWVVEEQRAAAGQWLGQIVKGVELPPAEWNFINGAGQRIRLEISTRMVDQGGKHAEVEGIARDVTERKRLESEILEISTREQRRIGHDLHDGVCQQLAGIAYRLDILADQLQEKGVQESSEAERIGVLINEAITQTRGVARGLFPVRLEEDGLASALEELAANAGTLFNLRCRFMCKEPPAAMENGAALHLYYIVQEAVVNAVKHGKATDVAISLTRALRPFHVDGAGQWAGLSVAGQQPHGHGYPHHALSGAGHRRNIRLAKSARAGHPSHLRFLSSLTNVSTSN